MGWKIEFAEEAYRQLHDLDKERARRIVAKLREISAWENPRASGKSLVGELSGLWRYRIGRDRVVVHIEDAARRILVLRIAHRSRAYR